jgi:hypothetical protein
MSLTDFMTRLRNLLTLEGKTTVNWYNYIACFFAGFFLANVAPHFVHGVSGDRFSDAIRSPSWRRIVIASPQRCVGAIQSVTCFFALERFLAAGIGRLLFSSQASLR